MDILEMIISISKIILITCFNFILGYNYGKKSKITIKEKELTKILVDNRIKDLEDKYDINIFLKEDFSGFDIEIFYGNSTIIKCGFLDLDYLYEYIKKDSIEKEIKSFLYDFKDE